MIDIGIPCIYESFKLCRTLCMKIRGEGGIWLRCLKTHYTVKAYLFKKTKSHQLFHGEFGSSFALKKNLSGRISTSPALLKYVINRRKITKEGVFWRVKNGAGMIRWIFCSRFSRQNWTKVKSRRPKWNEALIQNTADATVWNNFWRRSLEYHKVHVQESPKHYDKISQLCFGATTYFRYFKKTW